MKLGVIKRIEGEQLKKAKDIPAFTDQLLSVLNEFIEKVGTALQGNLDFENNMATTVKRLKFTHATELVLNPYDDRKAKLKVLGVLPLSSEGLGVDVMKWTDKGNGTIGVTINFSSGTQANCDILIIFKGG